MQSENLMAYAAAGSPGARSPEQRQIAELREQMEKLEYARKERGPTQRDDTPDHLSVSAAVQLLANDTRQLLEEIAELRQRLSPILAEQKTPPRERLSPAPVLCRMGAELSEVAVVVQQCRETVYLTLAQLDL